MVLLVKPAPRWSAALIEYPAGGELILMGGKTTAVNNGSGVYSYNGLMADSYSWSGSAWSLISSGLSGNTIVGPGPRAEMAYAYDGYYATLANGTDSKINLSDTWSYSTGTGWFKQPLTNALEAPIGSPPSYSLYTQPSLQRGASMAYQSSNGGGLGECVMISGISSSQRHFSLDTWNMVSGDPPTWTILSPTAFPSGRAYAAMASSPTTALLMGGKDFSGPLGSCWLWNGSNWSHITGLTPGVNSPSIRFGSAMAYNPNTTSFYLWGGCGTASTGYLFDLWVYSVGSGTWSQVPGTPGLNWPQARAFHNMAFHAGTGNIIMFAGLNNQQCFGETWSLNSSNQWTLLG